MGDQRPVWTSSRDASGSPSTPSFDALIDHYNKQHKLRRTGVSMLEETMDDVPFLTDFRTEHRGEVSPWLG